MASSHLVANRKGSLGRDINFNHLKDAAFQFIAMLHRIQLLLFLSLELDNLRPVLIDDFLSIAADFRGLDPSNIEFSDLLIKNIVVVAGPRLLSCRRVHHLDLQGLMNIIHHLPEQITFFRNDIRLDLPHLIFKRFSFFICFSGTAFEVARLNDNAFITTGHFQ